LEISDAAVEGRKTGTLAEGTYAALDSLEQKSQSVYEILSMLAPGPIVNLAIDSLSVLSSWTRYVVTTLSDKNANPYAGAKTDYFDKSIFNDDLLREAIRQDLGVDPPSA
jgi:hypothetical protein